MPSTTVTTTTPDTSRTPCCADLGVDEKDEKGAPSRSSGDFSEDGAQQSQVVSIDHMPDWFETNPYIHHGYRRISNSTRVSFASWRYVHNETVNIFSHFVPAVIFLLGEWYIFQYLNARYEEIVLGDYLVLAFFLLSATVCLGLSSSYHTLMNHSAPVESIWLRLDLVGIAILILGSFVSGIYVAFWCEVLERKVYWSMILGLGAVTIFIQLHPMFQGLKWRSFRALAFVLTGLSGFAPIGHGIHNFGIVQMMKQSGLPYYLGEGVVMCIGAGLFIKRFPECRYPGKFDIFGSSHQLFHILVVVGSVLHLIGVLAAYDYNYHHRSCRVR